MCRPNYLGADERALWVSSSTSEEWGEESRIWGAFEMEGWSMKDGEETRISVGNRIDWTRVNGELNVMSIPSLGLKE